MSVDAFCPYVGLQPFHEENRDYFFGRDDDQRVIISNLYASSLTVLYGASGVGKSSVLLAGVVPRLRESPNTAVVVFRDWASSTFLDELKRACTEAIEQVSSSRPVLDCSLPLDELLSQGAEALKGTVVVILDQFEEYFLYHPESEAGNIFDSEFARAVNREDVDAGFLLALREDSVAKLDRFRTRIPRLLSNTIRLRHLDEKSAIEAIRLPVERVYNSQFPHLFTSIEEGLVVALIEAARGRQVGAIGGVGHAAGSRDEGGIETALLQLLLTKLWKEERRPEHTSRVLRLQTLRDMGGAEKVVERHLAELMAALQPEQLEVCARIFDRLVTPSGTKVACREKDLVKWAEELGSHVPEVLRCLSTGESRILRPVAATPGDDSGVQYEILHDVLAGAVLEWRAGFLSERQHAELAREADEQRKRAEEKEQAASRLSRALWRARVFTGVALIGALAAWFYAREAAMQAKLSSSRALATAAINQTHIDPELGVLLALHAVETAKSVGGNVVREATDALGRTIEATRLRSSQPIGGPIQRAALSPDHKRLVVALENGTLHILKWPDGREEGPFQGQDAEFREPQFAPTGKLLAAIQSDGIVRIWNTETGQILQSLTPPGRPHVLCFSADGSMIAVGGEFTAWIWRLGTKKPVLIVDGHKDASGRSFSVTAMAFHPRAPVLATGAGDNAVRLWDVHSGKQVALLQGHTAVIEKLEFTPEGQELVSTSRDFTARIWNVATREHRVTLNGHANSVFSASYSRDGKKIVTASADATVRIWDAASGREIARLSSHVKPVSWVGFADEDRQVVSTSWDGTVKTWSASGHIGRIRSLWFSPDGRTVATSGEDRTIRLWDTFSGDELRALTGHRAPVTKIRFSPDGTRLVAADTEGRIEVWDPMTGQAVGSLCCQSHGIESIEFSPDGSKLVSAAGADVVLWNVTAGVLEKQLLSKSVFNREEVAFSPDGNWIAAGSEDGSVAIWSAADGKLVRELRAHEERIYRLVFSPDSAMIMTSGHDELAKLWHVASDEMRHKLEGHKDLVMQSVFTPDSSRLITSALSGGIIVWDTASGRRLPDGPSAHAGAAVLEITRDGTRLATFSWDRTAKVWDTKSWHELAALTHREQVGGGAISPDGTRIATFAYDGFRIVPLDLAELIRLAKSRVTRNLTADECRRYLQREDCPPLPV